MEAYMKRKVFFVLIHKRDFTGIKQVEGYEFSINKNKFYGYINSEIGKVYIIDPGTGRSVYDYPAFEGFRGINAIRNTIDMLKKDKHILEAFKRKKDTEKYGLMQETFKHFLHGAELEEKVRIGEKDS